MDIISEIEELKERVYYLESRMDDTKLIDNVLEAILDGMARDDDLCVKENYDSLNEAQLNKLWRLLNTKQKSTVRLLLQRNVMEKKDE